MAPNVADKLSRLSTIAFSGTTTLPVKRNSTANIAIAMMSPASHIRLASECSVSTSAAARPPTSTGAGDGTSRM